MARPIVVTLCGSTRFSEAFRTARFLETIGGKIVLTIGCDLRSDDDLWPRAMTDSYREVIKRELDELHLAKIDMSDEVLILNVGGYIGESTRRELDHAVATGKVVRYLEPVT